MTYREELIELPDGRALEVAAVGSPLGTTVFFHHGTPGATRSLRSWQSLLDYGDFYLVTASRPGYGRSSRYAGHDVSSAVDDATAALTHFGRARYVALGWSGGGPRALASAALDPACLGAVALASVAPADADFDWTEGMGPENVEEFRLARRGGPEYESLMESAGEAIATTTVDNLYDLFGGLFCDADREALSDDTERRAVAESFAYACGAGWHGYYDDNVAIMGPWGFDVTDIERPVHLFYGDDDLCVPPAHGAWLSSHVPGAVTHRHKDEGHVSIYVEYADELAEVISNLSA
ncbi:MAG: alpha/beta hydrolase [Acidimicrobiales bacterium]